jgi:TonB family protein
MSYVRPVALLVVVLLSGCEKRAPHHDVNKPASIEVEDEWHPPTTMVQVESIDKALGDVRAAGADERWEDVVSVAGALLKQQPGNTEAKMLRDQAMLEGPSKARFHAFSRAVEKKDTAGAAAAFDKIPDASMYKERARPELEHLREVWLASVEHDLHALVKAGRCDDAHRLAQQRGALFADLRPRLETEAAECQSIAHTRPEPARPPSPEPPASAPAAMASAALAPTPTPAPAPTPAPSEEVAPPAPPAPSPPPQPTAKPRTVGQAELEKLRTQGEKAPDLATAAMKLAKRDGEKTMRILVTVCVSDRGAPTAVSMTVSSKYPEANEKLVADIHKWRFKPYVADGGAVPVCAPYLFHYSLVD